LNNDTGLCDDAYYHTARVENLVDNSETQIPYHEENFP